MAAEDRIAKHVHIPLQSGSDVILKAMRRRYRTRHYAGRLEKARALMPHAAIGADVMVGFPGETEREFEETRRFIAEMPFTYLHVFSYSARPGTASTELPGEPPRAVKKQRNRVLRELVAEKNLQFRRDLIGTRLFGQRINPQHLKGGARIGRRSGKPCDHRRNLPNTPPDTQIAVDGLLQPLPRADDLMRRLAGDGLGRKVERLPGTRIGQINRDDDRHAERHAEN